MPLLATTRQFDNLIDELRRDLLGQDPEPDRAHRPIQSLLYG